MAIDPTNSAAKLIGQNVDYFERWTSLDNDDVKEDRIRQQRREDPVGSNSIRSTECLGISQRTEIRQDVDNFGVTLLSRQMKSIRAHTGLCVHIDSFAEEETDHIRLCKKEARMWVIMGKRQDKADESTAYRSPTV
ncbi:hypothetical protein T265_06029 [Opisthorchis viverrini]|uniref:Uncharacterized protein n=1 Tax=Opisthorchis viverrini TaxID=6198 RepID=A0A075AEK9_OPIVI|nr:hypothetical protein T265_06029 [Opisthorchis viverrini]KER26824.1 hypothetical protein T265_06029 [Opisthorchis viverrini]